MSSVVEQALTYVHWRLLYLVETSGNFMKQILIISILLGKKRQLPSFDGVTDTAAGTEMQSRVPSVSLDRLPEEGASSLPPTPLGQEDGTGSASPDCGVLRGVGDEESGHFWTPVPLARRPQWAHPKQQKAGPDGRPLPEVHA